VLEIGKAKDLSVPLRIAEKSCISVLGIPWKVKEKIEEGKSGTVATAGWSLRADWYTRRGQSWCLALTYQLPPHSNKMIRYRHTSAISIWNSISIDIYNESGYHL
jgi:hypothetical protein